MPTNQRVCIFGGTFDPVHLAHIKIAEEAKLKFHLDRVLLVPAANPPHKDAFTPYADRLRMVELACQGHPGLEASTLESGQDQSYTIDTVKRMCQTLSAGDQLFFLIGADAFDDLETWKGWTELVEMTDFIVVTRPESEYRVPAGAKVHRMDGLALQISSSNIRNILGSGEDVSELDAKVAGFIQQHGLYGWQPKQSTTVSP